MSKLVNPMTVMPDELESGDVMIAVVTLHVVRRGDGLVFRMYCCDYPPQMHADVPQGNRLGRNERAVMRELFPVVAWAGIEPDLF